MGNEPPGSQSQDDRLDWMYSVGSPHSKLRHGGLKQTSRVVARVNVQGPPLYRTNIQFPEQFSLLAFV